MNVCMHASSQQPQSPVTAGGPAFVPALKGSWTTPSSTASFSWIHASVLTQIRPRPHGNPPSSPQVLLRKEVKIVINILNDSLSAAFNDVPELIVKPCVQFITIPLVHIFELSFPTGHFPDILKLGKIQPRVKKGNEQYIKNYRPI